MTLGGQWNPADGVDSVDDTSLIQTVHRYAKDVTQLDLQNCRHWNCFLKIHYDRLGKDGLFSHKEVTVLFVPDFSEYLPSLDAWRDQWAMACSQEGCCREGAPTFFEKRDKEKDSSKDVKRLDKSGKKE